MVMALPSSQLSWLTVRTQRKRTLASAITYRVTSTVLLAAISYYATGQWVESAVVTITFALTATVLFYFNDRAWERTDWGRDSAQHVPISSPRSIKRASFVASEYIPLSHEFLEEAS